MRISAGTVHSLRVLSVVDRSLLGLSFGEGRSRLGSVPVLVGKNPQGRGAGFCGALRLSNSLAADSPGTGKTNAEFESGLLVLHKALTLGQEVGGFASFLLFSLVALGPSCCSSLVLLQETISVRYRTNPRPVKPSSADDARPARDGASRAAGFKRETDPSLRQADWGQAA